MQLRACDTCRRHIATTLPSCVFCGAAVTPMVRSTVAPFGRIGRAAVFAGAVLVSPTSACHVNTQPTYERLPPPPGGESQPSISQVRGRVVDEDGVGVSGQLVTLYGEALRTLTGSTSIMATSDQTGDFLFDKIPPGGYHLATSGSDRRAIDARPNEAVKINLVVHPRPKADPHHMAKPYGAPPARRRHV